MSEPVARSLRSLDDAKQLLATKGYDPQLGARPLRRVIQNSIEDALSEGILAGTYQPGDTIEAEFLSGRRETYTLLVTGLVEQYFGLGAYMDLTFLNAIHGATKAMAIEFGPHKVRINTICPTFIVTDLTRSTFEQPDKRQWIEEKIKLGRVGEIEDIMGAAVYFASDASALVTGTSLLVDGGWTAD